MNIQDTHGNEIVANILPSQNGYTVLWFDHNHKQYKLFFSFKDQRWSLNQEPEIIYRLAKLVKEMIYAKELPPEVPDTSVLDSSQIDKCGQVAVKDIRSYVKNNYVVTWKGFDGKKSKNIFNISTTSTRYGKDIETRHKIARGFISIMNYIVDTVNNPKKQQEKEIVPMMVDEQKQKEVVNKEKEKKKKVVTLNSLQDLAQIKDLIKTTDLNPHEFELSRKQDEKRKQHQQERAKIKARKEKERQELKLIAEKKQHQEEEEKRRKIKEIEEQAKIKKQQQEDGSARKSEELLQQRIKELNSKKNNKEGCKTHRNLLDLSDQTNLIVENGPFKNSKVTLLTKTGPDSSFPIVGIIQGIKEIFCWTKYGVSKYGDNNNNNIITKPLETLRWVNLYANGNLFPCLSYGISIAHAKHYRSKLIARKPFHIKEGEFVEQKMDFDPEKDIPILVVDFYED